MFPDLAKPPCQHKYTLENRESENIVKLKVEKLLINDFERRALLPNLANHHGHPEKSLKVCELLFTPSLSVLEGETEKDEIIRKKIIEPDLEVEKKKVIVKRKRNFKKSEAEDEDAHLNNNQRSQSYNMSI